MAAKLGIHGTPQVVELETKRRLFDLLSSSVSRLIPFTESPIQYRMQLR